MNQKLHGLFVTITTLFTEEPLRLHRSITSIAYAITVFCCLGHVFKYKLFSRNRL